MSISPNGNATNAFLFDHSSSRIGRLEKSNQKVILYQLENEEKFTKDMKIRMKVSFIYFQKAKKQELLIFQPHRNIKQEAGMIHEDQLYKVKSKLYQMHAEKNTHFQTLEKSTVLQLHEKSNCSLDCEIKETIMAEPKKIEQIPEKVLKIEAVDSDSEQEHVEKNQKKVNVYLPKKIKVKRQPLTES